MNGQMDGWVDKQIGEGVILLCNTLYAGNTNNSPRLISVLLDNFLFLNPLFLLPTLNVAQF